MFPGKSRELPAVSKFNLIPLLSLLSSHPITLLPSTACNVSEPELQQVLDGVHEVPGHWLATDGARGWRARGPGRQRAKELEAGPHKVLDVASPLECTRS